MLPKKSYKQRFKIPITLNNTQKYHYDHQYFTIDHKLNAQTDRMLIFLRRTKEFLSCSIKDSEAS